MNAFQRLLIATDLSERAERAEARAALLAREQGSAVAELMTVREKEEAAILARIMNAPVEATTALATEHAERVLAFRASLLNDNYGLHCSVRVRFGTPASEIIAGAEALKADLIVMGAHGGNFFSDLVLGNTVDKVTRISKTPVLIVKNQPQKPYQHVLVPVDFTEDSRRAAQAALAIAPTADVTFLHVFEVPFEGKMQYANVSTDIVNHYRLQAYEDGRTRLNAFIDDLAPGERHIQRLIEFGLPGPTVRERAKTHRPDLVAVGKHGKSGFAELLLGSVTRDTIEQTDCDVLVVRGESVP